MKSRRKKQVEKPRRHKKTYKKSFCAPGSGSDNTMTCYSNKNLLNMRTYWNSRHPDKKINSKDPRTIWMQLKENMSHICNTERCWLNQAFIKDSGNNDLLNYTFVPDSPKIWNVKPNEWLTSVDIENVMKQYERAYPCFQFLGPSPIDFDKKKGGGKQCVWNELCYFDLQSFLHKGCNKIGMIFNTDPHYLNGSHWIALFINMKKNYIYYFDSVGDKAPKEINILIDRIMDQSEKLGNKLQRFDNTTKHQRSNSECGMYCLYFIIHALKDIHPQTLMSQRVPDEVMERFRKIYFNPSEA